MANEQCPLASNSDVFKLPKGGWQKRGEDRACVYCGSWHPEEFIAWVNAMKSSPSDGVFSISIGTPDKRQKLWMPRMEVSDRKNKIYVHREGIRNAGDGPIKVYVAHLNAEQIATTNELVDLLCSEVSRLRQLESSNH